MSESRNHHAADSSGPAVNLPTAVAWLAGIMVAVHLVRLMLPLPADYLVVEYLAFDSSAYTDPGVFAAKPAAPLLGPVTHVFLHADAVHLAVNAGLFVAFGAVVARRMGAPWFVVFFLLCGVAGAAAWFALHPTSPALLIGASGAISGMIGATTRLGIERRPSAAGRPPFRSRRQALTIAAVWLALNFLFGLIGGRALGLEGAVAWEAHLGGFVAGFLLAYIFDGRGLAPGPGAADAADATPGTEARNEHGDD